MKLLTAAILLAFVSVVAAEPSNQKSTAPSSSRFELVQSELAAKVTLKVDKFTGITYQLVTGQRGLSWQRIPMEKHPQDNQQKAGSVNYQVFTSGMQVRMTYLMNVQTGATWQMSEDPEEGVFWNAIE